MVSKFWLGVYDVKILPLSLVYTNKIKNKDILKVKLFRMSGEDHKHSELCCLIPGLSLGNSKDR